MRFAPATFVLASLAVTLMVGCKGINPAASGATSGGSASGSVSPSTAPAAYTLRDYFFPYTASFSAHFDEADTSQYPDGSHYGPSSGYDNFAIASLTGNTAVLTMTTNDGSSTQYATQSLTLQPDGSITTAQQQNGQQTLTATSTYSAALLTLGATVTITPATKANQFIADVTMTQVGTETVTVPAGTYTALKFFEAEGPSSSGSLWFAPGVGLVKSYSNSSMPWGNGSTATFSTTVVLHTLAR